MINFAKIFGINTRKLGNAERTNMPVFDRPKSKPNFAKILNGTNSPMADKALSAFLGNSAFGTRMRGSRPR